jgi:hypothetical protein
MSIRRRLIAVPLVVGLFALGAVLLWQQSGAQAGRAHFGYTKLNKIQRRIISSTLASALLPTKHAKKTARMAAPGPDGGPGADGLPNTPPSGFGAAGSGKAAGLNYFPSASGKCDSNLGANVKVNQNCLNISDPTLQGRGQANNETSIAQDALHPAELVASDNNYIRGDGTCGAHFSTDGGKTWADSTIPNSFTSGLAGNARQYWQAGGDTSVAWDTRGNAYESCQLFNRGTAASANPDQSSGFVVFRSTGNDGASWNFPGRYVTSFFDPTGTAGVLEDKQLIAVDNHVNSPFRDRIYVSWTEFTADGTAYIWEAHSSNYGESFSPRTLVSSSSRYCTNTFGVGTLHGSCNENQFSQPFVGSDGALYVTWANFNNQPTTGHDNRYEMLLAKSTDGGQTFSAPVKVSDYYDLPDCDTYQGAGADPGRACVPEKGKNNRSVFRATNYPAGAVDTTDPSRVVVTFGSYINRDSNESNGCEPAGFASDGNPMYTGVKTAGACNNKILVSVSTDGGKTFSSGAKDPRDSQLVTTAAGQSRTDQFWQWAAFTRTGALAVDYYDRQYGSDETSGASDFSLSGSSDMVSFGQTRVTSSSMPAPTQFYGPNGGQFYGDYIGLAALDKAHPIWSDTRARDLFLCPDTAKGPGNPPALCGGIEPNGQEANDEETYTATVNVPVSGHGG